jgi:hypothetical protein
MAKTEHEFARALMGRLPGSVRVGPFEFSITLWDQHQATGAQRYGECSSVEQALRFQGDMPTRWKAVDTFFHEVSHAIYWAYGVHDDDKEERIVGALGTALAALYRDNPWLTGWIDSAKL